MVRLGSHPIGVAEAILGEINFLRPQQGRVKAGSSSQKRGFSFSTRASQLWRFSLGSNAAVLKKIGLVAYLCRSKCSFRPPGVRRPRGFFLPMLNADGAGYRSR